MPLTSFLQKYDPEAARKLDPNSFPSRVERLKNNQPLDNITRRGVEAPTGVLSSTLDFFSRGNYGAAKFTDVLINEDGEALAKTWRAFKEGFGEIVSPQERLLFEDVIKTHNPVWAANNPKKAFILGLAGDLVVDPINLISFGAGSVLKSGTKIATKSGKIVALSNPGRQVFKKLGESLGDDVFEGFNKRQSILEIMQETIEPTKISALKRDLDKIDPDLVSRQLKGKVSALTGDSISRESGVFLTSFDDLLNFSESKKLIGDKGLLSQRDLNKLKKQMSGEDEISQAMLESFVQGSPKFEVTPVTDSPFAPRLNFIRYGSKKNTDVAVIIPDKYITARYTGKDDVVSRIFSSTAFDLNDLRFVTHDSDVPMSFSQLKNHISGRELTKKKIIERTKQAQSLGESTLKKLNLSPEELLDSGGFKLLGKSVISSQNFADFARVIRLPQAYNAVKDLPGISELRTIGQGLADTFGLHRILEKEVPEWVRQRRHIEALRHEAMDSAEKAYKHLFSVETTKGTKKLLDREAREEINQFLSDVQKLTKERLEATGSTKISHEFGAKIFSEALSASNLSKEQKSVVVKLRAAYNDMARTELEAGLLQDFFVNYNPARYEAMNKIRRFTELKRWQSGQPINRRETFTKTKKFASAEEALEAGYDPIVDSGRLFVMRFLEHKAALRRNEWKIFLENAYGTSKITKIPKIISEDLVRLGETFYEPRYSEAGRLGLEVFNTVNNIFRKSATVVRPAFTAKQIVGNMTQSLAEMGTDALRVFDPRVLGDSIAILQRKGEVPFDLVDVFGQKYSKEELTQIFKELPILKNVAIENVGYATESDMIQQLTSDLYTKFQNQKSNHILGMSRLFVGGSKFLKIPAVVEDLYRSSMFMAALRAGNTPQVAIEIVDNALFNYTSGLHRWEQSIRTSLVPFFSFTKFGTELVARTVMHHPGRIAIGDKMVQNFYSVINKMNGGEELTPAERSAIPGYMLEQPSVFTRFENMGEQTKARFLAFNNMVFFDVINFIQTDENNNFNAQETLIKGALSQLAPFWKIPLEIGIFKRQLFTDKALDGAYAGSIGNVDYDQFFRNIFVASGMHQGLTGGVVGGAAAEIINSIGGTEESFKSLIGWEEGTNSSGERTVFINPYLLNVTASIFPSLNTALRLSRNDLSDWDKVLYGAFGVTPSYLDLKKSARFKLLDYTSEKDKKLYEFKSYMNQGRLDSADVARMQLLELMEENEKNVNLWMEAYNSAR